MERRPTFNCLEDHANVGGPPEPSPEGMVWIPGGEFSMGAAEESMAKSDAGPIHRVYVDGFWMDHTEVTNGESARFVRATGYVTVAERVPRAEDFPGVPPDALRAGSSVFTPPNHPVPLDTNQRCSTTFCTRYLVGARGKGEISTGTNHLGFRCVRAPGGASVVHAAR